jgi:ABC-type transport system involved in cytochrome c biogenesis ATPase subunit
MLTKWGITNFKSIYHADLDLAPLTVLTGTNSSGKSSFLQSILMMAQTIRNPFCDDNTLMLNGPLVRLGLPSSITSLPLEEDGSETDKVSLGIRWEYSTYTRFDANCYHSFLSQDDYKSGWTKTDKGFIRWNPVKSEALFGINQKFGYFLKEISYDLDYLVSDIEFDIFDHFDKQGSQFQNPVGLGISLLSAKHLTAIKYLSLHKPPGFTEVLKQSQLKRKHIKMKARNVEYFRDENDHLAEGPNDGLSNSYGPIFLLKELKPGIILREKGRKPVKYEEVWIKRLLPEHFAFSRDKDSPIVQAGGTRMDIREIKTGPFLGLRCDMSDYFSRVKYLGPFRFQGPLYEFSSASDPRDVGYDGRYTAAALYNWHYNGSPLFDIARHEIDAHKNLDGWLQYLGVAEGVEVNETKNGYEIQARVKSGGVEKLVDLNHVGTGLSHVLPVLVMCLLAERGSLLIIDQPEMYLHPRVQSRLADFFVEVVRSGRQCIIETHSEYIISQLRYRISKALMQNDQEIPELVKIYFASKKDGKTDFEEIRVTKYGGLSKWPDGFFDERQKIKDKLIDEMGIEYGSDDDDESDY